jgi:hypothetical protein
MNSTSRTSARGRAPPTDRADDAWHHDGAAGAPAYRHQVVEIDTREGGRKAVRIALADPATDLAVGDECRCR